VLACGRYAAEVAPESLIRLFDGKQKNLLAEYRLVHHAGRIFVTGQPLAAQTAEEEVPCKVRRKRSSNVRSKSRPMLEADVASAARRCPRFFMARLGFPNATRIIAADSRRKR
jgi:hypothetical protein